MRPLGNEKTPRRMSNDDLFSFDNDSDQMVQAAQDMNVMESGTMSKTMVSGSMGSGSEIISKTKLSGSAAIGSQIFSRAKMSGSGGSMASRIITKLSGSGSILPLSATASQYPYPDKKWTWWNKHVRKRDEYSKLKADFIQEMRQLSKLRHPCIVQIMGAVISPRQEPMLVMEFMDHGSLYDLLHNETMTIEGELVLPILRDIVSGIRFLHAATPEVIHGDLKAQNVLVDIKLRAKVSE